MKAGYKLEINNAAKYAALYWEKSKKISKEWTEKMNRTCEQIFPTIEEVWVYANVWRTASRVPLNEIRILELGKEGEVIKDYTYEQAWEIMEKVNIVIENGDFSRSIKSYILSRYKIKAFESLETIAEIHPTNIRNSMTPEQIGESSNGRKDFLLPERLVSLFNQKPANFSNRYASQYDSRGRELRPPGF